MTKKIITSQMFPAVPSDSFDWCAYYDDSEPDGYYGWGRTEKEAIEDLKSWDEIE